MRKNVASQIVDAQLINKADGTPCTTGTTNVYVSGDGGPQALAGGSPSCFHLGQGLWSYVATAAESNYDHVAFTFVNSNAINFTIQIYTSFPQTGDNFVRLGAPAGASVSADVAALKTGQDLVKSNTDKLGDTLVADGSPGNYRFSTNALAATWDSQRGGHALAGSFGEGVASVQGNVTGSVASVTGAVGSVTGLTASDVGAIKTKTDFLPSATAGAAGGLFIAGTNAATSITTGLTSNIVGNITGNLSGSVGSVTGAVGSVVGLTASDVGAIKVVTDKVNSTLISVGSPTDYIFTAPALSLAPSGTGASAVAIADEVQTRTIAGVTLVATTTNLTNAPTNGDLTATMKTSVTTAATAATPTAAAVTGSVGSVVGLTASNVGAIKTVTDKLNTTMESVGSPGDYVFTAPALAQAPAAPTAVTIANQVLRVALTEGYAAQGAPFTLEQFAYMIHSIVFEPSIVSTTLTSGKLNHTAAMTFSLDSGTAPTSQQRAT